MVFDLAQTHATQSRAAERRRHRRVAVSLAGRYMLSDRQDYPCQVVDMSPGGVALVAPVPGEVRERVVCHIDHVGRLEGTVVRPLAGGFALQVNVPLVRREKLAEQLTWLANRAALDLIENRRQPRLAPRQTRTELTLADGARHPATVVDLSPSGAGLACEVRPAVDSRVTVGAVPARVVRVAGQGLAVEFLDPLPAEGFGDAVRL